MDEHVETARRLGLLASAVAGRRIDVALAEPDEPSWTDGTTIYLAHDLDERESIQAIAVQSAMLAAGSLAPEIVDQLRRGRDVCPRYLAIEGRRALASVQAVLPNAAVSLLAGTPTASSPEQSLELARGAVPIEAPPIVFGQIKPRAIRQAPAPQVQTHSDPTSTRASGKLHELDDAADLDDPHRSTADDLSSPVGGGGAIGKLLQRLAGGVRGRDAGSPGADAGTHVARQGRSSGRRTGTTAGTAQLEADSARLGPPGVHSYPEWDCHRGTYRPGWCTVRERDAAPGEGHGLAVTESRALLRVLGRVMPDLTRVHRRMQGDDLDIDAVVSERVDLLAGVTPDEAVYVDSTRSARELAVLILLDVSASAGEPSVTGASVHDHQRAAAAALATSLHSLGDRVAVDAFRSMGRDNVEVVPIKRFDGLAGATMLRRLAALTPGAYTRLGAAIRHGCATLERDACTARRLLIVISDGFAYDHGYEGRYGESDARRALTEARRAGIGCLCLSIGGVTEADALTRVFGTAAHASVTELEELPAVVAALFPAALRSADQRRRHWQHHSRTSQRLELDRRTA